MNKRDLFSKVSKILCLYVFFLYTMYFVMYFLLFMLNQCKILVADRGHRGSGSVLVNQFSRGGVWGPSTK